MSNKMPPRWNHWDDYLANPGCDMEDAVTQSEMKQIIKIMRRMAESMTYVIEDPEFLDAQEYLQPLKLALDDFNEWGNDSISKTK